MSGSGFLPTSLVEENGSALATTFGSAAALTAILPASDLATGGTLQITVVNPAPGGGASAAQTVTVTNPAPVLGAMSPFSAVSGSAQTTLSVSGSGFLASSLVEWNGDALATSYTSATTLTATLPAADLAAANTAQITVVNAAPGGGASAAKSFAVVAPAALLTVPIQGNSAAWSAASGLFYVSTPSTAPNGNSIVPVDPLTGAQGTAVFAGSEPDLLSVSATGAYLYVGLDGASAVERMTLPNLQVDISLPLGADSDFGPYHAAQLAASPVDDHMVAVGLGNYGLDITETGGIAVFTDAVDGANPLCPPGFPPVNCISPPVLGDPLDVSSLTWNSDATEMYMANNDSTGFDFYTAAYGSAGFSSVTVYPYTFSSFRDTGIHWDPTTDMVYSNDGQVVDPASGQVVGQFAASGWMVPDGAHGLAYFLGYDELSGQPFLESFDIHTYAQISTYPLPTSLGQATALIRWGANGLAFLSQGSSPYVNALFIVNDPSFVGNSAANPTAQAVHLTARPRKPAQPATRP